MGFLAPDQFGGYFTIVLFCATVGYMFWKPKDFFWFVLGFCGVAVLPYGFFCLYGWHGVEAYNAFMVTLAVVDIAARS